MISKYQPLLQFIEYFSNKDNVFYEIHEGREENGTYILGGIKYSKGVSCFVEKASETEFTFIGDYFDWQKSNNGRELDIIKFINNSDIETLRKIGTYYIRGERFCDGMWCEAIDKKIFLSILLRLRVLLEG